MSNLVERTRTDDVKFISLQFTDMVGNIKSVDIPVDRLEQALEQGVWFDGSSVEGFARISESDMLLRPDPVTYRVLPWSRPDRRRARLICNVHTINGDPFPGDPRCALQRVLARAREQGWIFNTGPEPEFYLFRRDTGATTRPVPNDVGGYFDFSPRDQAQQVRSDIISALQALGLQVEASHHEVGEGQHEIDFGYTDALTSADNAVTFKYTVKAIAVTYDLFATFMPKPIFGAAGSGMHTHQSMADQTGRNLFYHPDDPYHLSPLAYHFIAGQLAHARAMTAVIAPTVNSYKRLVPGYEAPTYVCWAQVNRSSLIRIPRFAPGQSSAARAELRCPDPSCNPYLAFAVMLAAGLDGIERELDPPPAVNEDVYAFSPQELAQRDIDVLPGTLGEALEALEADQVIKEALGDHILESFIRAKQAEWDTYRIQVTGWELERYLMTL